MGMDKKEQELEDVEEEVTESKMCSMDAIKFIIFFIAWGGLGECGDIMLLFYRQMNR